MSQLELSLESYEGPLDVLLELVKKRRYDLENLDILSLAEQYINFVESLDRNQMVIAAEHLRMACYLTWLKSRLMLPAEEVLEDEIDPEIIEAQLESWIKHLSKLRELIAALMDSPQESRNFFRRGYVSPAEIKSLKDQPIEPAIEYEASLSDLIFTKAKLDSDNAETAPLLYGVNENITLEDALEAIRSGLSALSFQDLQWINVWDTVKLLHSSLVTDQQKSLVATMFCAALELARLGEINIMQEGVDAPLMISPSERFKSSSSAGSV